MIPKDRLHCPLRTLSLACPLLARRSFCFNNEQSNPIRNSLGPKSIVYRYAPYTYRDSSASCLEGHYFFFACLSRYFFARSF
jgi:hypothetical protein